MVAWFVYPIVLAAGAIVEACTGGDEKQDSCAAPGCHTTPSKNGELITEFKVNGVMLEKDAHRFHFNPVLKSEAGLVRVSEPLACDKCHPVPDNVWEGGYHNDGEVQVFLKAPGKDPDPKLFGGTYYMGAGELDLGECSNTACHGVETKEWKVDQSGPEAECKSCHEETVYINKVPVKHNVEEGTECATCHDQTMNKDGSFKSLGLHMNGRKEVVGDTCIACHEDPPNNHKKGINNPETLEFIEECSNCHIKKYEYPFRVSENDTHMDGLPTINPQVCSTCHDEIPETAVHDAHVELESSISVPCEECHRPVVLIKSISLDEEGKIVIETDLFNHMQDDWPVVEFSGLAIGKSVQEALALPAGVKPTYKESDNESGGTCTNVYCHGVTLPEGKLGSSVSSKDKPTAPENCNVCHGNPPSSNQTVHDDNDDKDCVDCHYAEEDYQKYHVDGKLQVIEEVEE